MGLKGEAAVSPIKLCKLTGRQCIGEDVCSEGRKYTACPWVMLIWVYPQISWSTGGDEI